MTARLFLASQSPRRKQILKKLGIAFSVVPSAYEEKHRTRDNPRQLVMRHAEGKAQKAIAPARACFILGADTAVVCGGKILGKPKSEKHAEQMLRTLSGKYHDVYTAFVLIDREKKKKWKRVVRTRVKIRALSKLEIAAYVRKAKSLDKAGAYGIQSKPEIVEKFRGSYTNVVGLPAEALLKVWEKISRD